MILPAKRSKKPPSVTRHSPQGPHRLLRTHCDPEMATGPGRAAAG